MGEVKFIKKSVFEKGNAIKNNLFFLRSIFKKRSLELFPCCRIWNGSIFHSLANLLNKQSSSYCGYWESSPTACLPGPGMWGQKDNKKMQDRELFQKTMCLSKISLLKAKKKKKKTFLKENTCFFITNWPAAIINWNHLKWSFAFYYLSCKAPMYIV